MMIRDQVLIKVGAYNPINYSTCLGTANTSDLSILVKNKIKDIFQTFRTIFSSSSVISKIKQLKP